MLIIRCRARDISDRRAVTKVPGSGKRLLGAQGLPRLCRADTFMAPFRQGNSAGEAMGHPTEVGDDTT
jgi:hypothetical protein